MLVPKTAVTMDIASMVPVTVRLVGLARHVLKRLVPLIATIKVTVLEDLVFAIPNTPVVIVLFNNAPTDALVLEVVST
jgi:hypothetical protein